VALIAVFATTIAYQCPNPTSIQDSSLASNFNINQFVGPEPYYELALHDYTQPSICGCMRSVKSIVGNEILDNFTMACPWNVSFTKSSKIYISPLSFNLTSSPGVLDGHWKVAGTRIS
jgi:hypothetical protein